MSNFDLYLFQKIHQLWISEPWLDVPMWFSAKFLMYFLVGTFLLWSLFTKDKEKRRERLKISIIALAAAIISRFFFTEIIRLALPRPRPFAFLDFYPLITEPGLASNSFPSGHAAFFFAFAMVVFLYFRKTGLIFFLAGLLIGFARIYVGVHWPSDVIFGTSLGILVGFTTYLLASKQKISNLFNTTKY
jgi:undecaprenyl-diphosphatase